MNRTEWLARCRRLSRRRLSSEDTMTMLAEDAERESAETLDSAEYIPDEDEIAERAAAIRAFWPPSERRRRRITKGRNEVFPWYHTRRDCTYGGAPGGTGSTDAEIEDLDHGEP